LVARNEIIFRWSLYAAAALALCLVQGFLLQFLRLFGAMPFLFPAVAACVGMFEGPFAGAAFGLILGVACDLTVAAPIPCFYTLIFPLADCWPPSSPTTCCPRASCARWRCACWPSS
jgi:hypothetical protein